MTDDEPTSVVIETARLRLRLLRDDDLADLVALIGNWEVARWVSSVPHPHSEADGREWIEMVQKDHATGCPRRFAVALKENDRIIGGVGLDGDTGTETDEPALGYWLGQPYWGKGYGREAVAAVIDYGFRTLGIRTIRAYTDPSMSTPERICIGGRSKIASRSDVRRPRAEALVGSQHHQSQLSCSINEPAFPSRPGIPLPRRAA